MAKVLMNDSDIAEIVRRERKVGAEVERAACAQKARELASYYEQGSNCRKAFIIFAEWIKNRDQSTST